MKCKIKTDQTGKPYAGNPHVRFDEGEIASAATPRRGSLHYKGILTTLIVLAAAVFCAEAAFAFEIDLRMARIEMSSSCATNESQRLAAKELEKHLALIAGSRTPVAAACPGFVIGKIAPGCKEASAHEARAHAFGGKVYF